MSVTSSHAGWCKNRGTTGPAGKGKKKKSGSAPIQLRRRDAVTTPKRILLRNVQEGETQEKMSRYVVVVYYESIKRELKIRGIYECRCDGKTTLWPVRGQSFFFSWFVASHCDGHLRSFSKDSCHCHAQWRTTSQTRHEHNLAQVLHPVLPCIWRCCLRSFARVPPTSCFLRSGTCARAFARIAYCGH